MQVWPCSRQIPHQLLTAQFFTGRMPFLLPNQQRQSTEGMYVCTCTGTINAFSNKIFSPLYNKPSLPDLFLQAFLTRLTLKRKHLRITGGSFSQDGCHSCYQKTVGLLKLWQHLCSVIQMLITTTQPLKKNGLFQVANNYYMTINCSSYNLSYNTVKSI